MAIMCVGRSRRSSERGTERDTPRRLGQPTIDLANGLAAEQNLDIDVRTLRNPSKLLCERERK